MTNNFNNKILIFNSIYILKFIELVYLKIIEILATKYSFNKSSLIIVRNDKRGKFTTSTFNISGIKSGKKNDEINTLSLQFYRHLSKYGCQSRIFFDNKPLYDLYIRQIKLKLANVIEAALQLHEWSLSQNKDIEIISDAQTIEIFSKTLSFLGLQNKKIKWTKQLSLTFIITVNSLLMRSAVAIKNFISKSELPITYYKKQYDQNYPTILITLPAKSPEAFFESYVKKIKYFNVVFYSILNLKNSPKGYKSKIIKLKKKKLSGLFSFFGYSSLESYISDTMLIYDKHIDLEICTNVVEFIFDNEKIDILLNRQQVSVVNNYFVELARKLKISIISDVFEEIYTCDAAILACKADLTGLTKFVIGSSPYVVRGVNEFMKYRLYNFKDRDTNYIKSLLDIEKSQNIIFYASNPLRLERQRYELELFLINQFSLIQNIFLVIKIHPQDTGKTTLLAFNHCNRPNNVKIIYDASKRLSKISSDFNIYPDFDFNAAISSSDGFITSHSSSVIQALALNKKIGILDRVNHFMYRPMVDNGGAVLIDGISSLKYFLSIDRWNVSDDALKFYGLKASNNKNFDLGSKILSLAGLNRNNQQN